MTNRRSTVRRKKPAAGVSGAGSVEVHIGELVLHGFAPGDRHRIGAAVEQELARLLAESSRPAAWARRRLSARVDGGSFRLASGAKPGAIGAQIAAAIHGGLVR